MPPQKYLFQDVFAGTEHRMASDWPLGSDWNWLHKACWYSGCSGGAVVKNRTLVSQEQLGSILVYCLVVRSPRSDKAFDHRDTAFLIGLYWSILLCSWLHRHDEHQAEFCTEWKAKQPKFSIEIGQIVCGIVVNDVLFVLEILESVFPLFLLPNCQKYIYMIFIT